MKTELPVISKSVTHFSEHPALPDRPHGLPAPEGGDSHFQVTQGSVHGAITKAWPKPSGFTVTLQGVKYLETDFIKWLLKTTTFFLKLFFSFDLIQ